MKPIPYIPLYELTRGNTRESVHYGAVAVVDANGKLIASAGDPYGVAFLRSTAKPFQLIPFVEAGGIEHFGFTQKQVALMCASHSGTDKHVKVARKIQKKAGFKEKDLMCGVHPPYHQKTANRLLIKGKKLTSNRHNCSGKHSGMLAYAKMLGASLDDYLEPSHLVQQAILGAFAGMADLPVEEVELGIDGCSAPNFAVPFYNGALAMAHLADPSSLSVERAAAVHKISAAMMKHPDMVGGPGRFDTVLMKVAKGKLVSKGGAEGYEGVAVMPGVVSTDSPGIGIAIKVSDGDRRKQVVAAVTMEVLRQLGILGAPEIEQLAKFGPEQHVYNWRKLVVGEARPLFALERH